MFKSYLTNIQKISERSIKHYTGAIETISKDCNIDLYQISEISEFKKIKQIIINNKEYNRKNQRC